MSEKALTTSSGVTTNPRHIHLSWATHDGTHLDPLQKKKKTFATILFNGERELRCRKMWWTNDQVKMREKNCCREKSSKMGHLPAGTHTHAGIYTYTLTHTHTSPIHNSPVNDDDYPDWWMKVAVTPHQANVGSPEPESTMTTFTSMFKDLIIRNTMTGFQLILKQNVMQY